MSNTSSSQCVLQPNPDISGIGVRASIYFQALLGVIYPIIFVWDLKIIQEKEKKLTRISTNITITACALLVSTITQASIGELSLYHILIILQLSWINSLASILVLIALEYTFTTSIPFPNSYVAAAILSMSVGPRLVYSFFVRQVPRFFKVAMVLSTLHLMAMGAIGIWVWNNVQTFGDHTTCNEDTFLVVLLKTVYARGPKVRTVSIVLYATALLPIYNILIITFLLDVLSVTLHLIYIVLKPTYPSYILTGRTARQISRFFAYTDILSIVTAMIILIVDIELTIHRSSKLVQPGENQWTFGQTLAMVLQILPLWELVVATWKTVSYTRRETSVVTPVRSIRSSPTASYLPREHQSVSLPSTRSTISKGEQGTNSLIEAA